MKYTLLTIMLVGFLLPSFGQETQKLSPKRERRRNLVVKEWNKASAGKANPFLDHITTYDSLGRKIEEIEYTYYGQKERVTYEYGENGRCSREVVYNDRDKPERIKKFEYYSDGTKKRQYNYYPNGKLESVKEYEYIFK